MRCAAFQRRRTTFCNLPRTRTQLTRELAQHIQRIQKTLEDANIKLVSVISDIVGVSGRAHSESDDRGRDERDAADRTRIDPSEVFPV
jgi:hypothetical protein